MTRAQTLRVRITFVGTALLPTLAVAHPGHAEASSFAAGALHPLGGIDHLAGFFIVGLLAARLGGRHLPALVAALLGLLVAASTSASDGWQFAAGFMLAGAVLIAAGMGSMAAATRLCASLTTAGGRRSPT